MSVDPATVNTSEKDEEPRRAAAVKKDKSPSHESFSRTKTRLALCAYFRRGDFHQKFPRVASFPLALCACLSLSRILSITYIHIRHNFNIALRGHQVQKDKNTFLRRFYDFE